MLPNSLPTPSSRPIDRHSDHHSEGTLHEETSYNHSDPSSTSDLAASTAALDSAAKGTVVSVDSITSVRTRLGDHDSEEEEELVGPSGVQSSGIQRASLAADRITGQGDESSEAGSTRSELRSHTTQPPHIASNDEQPPLFEFAHSLEVFGDSELPFGLQITNNSTGHISTPAHDDGMSDDDDGGGGGVSLNGASLDWNHHYQAGTSHNSILNDNSGPTQPHVPGEQLSGMSTTLQPPGSPLTFMADYPWANTIIEPYGLPFGLTMTDTAAELSAESPQSWAPADSLESDFPDQPAPEVATADIQPPAPTFDDFPPLMPSGTNSTILGSENVGLVDFLRLWSHVGLSRSTKEPPPDINQVYLQARKRVNEVTYSDLQGDKCDLQGLSWADMCTTRSAARLRRHKTYKNYVNCSASDIRRRGDTWIPPNESFFRFRKMMMRSDISLAHFQLRNVLACPSRSQIYYASARGINRLNPFSRKTDLALNFSEFPVFGRTITALDANAGVLVGGTFKGEFVIKPLHSEDKRSFSDGLITDAHLGITNHVQVHTPRRSSSPVAAFCNNDHGFRVLDIQTEQILSDFLYQFPLNCSAISPDRRLRVLVGDERTVTITNAETGDTEVELDGHRDYGFACDWSPDGRFVATGSQDRSIKIWDARKWTDSRGSGTPLASIWTDIAGARSLRFSPLGSGEPVLVAAEEADYVNIINAETFDSKQTIDLFGEIGGIAFSDEGQELNVLVSDQHRGGLIQLQRCGLSNSIGPHSMMEQITPF